MTEERKITGRFVFGIQIAQNPDGTENVETTSKNNNIPEEILIMQMKAYLKNIEKKYFDNFNFKEFKFKP